MPGTRWTRWMSRLPHAIAALPWTLASIAVIVLLFLLVKALVAVLGHDRYAEHGAGSRSEAVMVPGVPVATESVLPSPSPTKTRRESGGGPGAAPPPAGRTPTASRSVTPSVSVTPSTASPSPKPTTLLNDDAPGISYRGRWAVSRDRPYGDHRDDVHYTIHDGDSFSFTFTGTGLDYITSRDPEYGDADVWIVDAGGRPVKQQRVSARANRYQPQQTVFSVRDLPVGTYTIWAVKRNGVYFQVDALRVRG
ncbi:hypothetical protein GA0070216_101132 [Micromonospora matsumotoense]|uniref:Uncharacterized protein n=1 Tax=Micromonospora matsumotoense TaxID=121616 RepID=A0A1C4TZH7_9ACTN|nr:hypothetical protein [Micromonospora matsumotoense]SCE64862.1 hypothetical protein GA0070216_101132 [Micromonospora matsumotoense]